MKRFFLLPFWLVCLLATSSLSVHAQLTIKDGTEVVLNNIVGQLQGQGVFVQNVKLKVGGVENTTPAAKQMYGTYTSADPDDQDGIGQSGMLITCGNAKPAKNSSGVFISTNKGFQGDPNIAGSFDGCAIEFDVYPIGNEISFNYCFASEEYDEWVCSPYNDAFKFLVTGYNPTNPGQPYNKINIAAIPGTPADPIANTLGKEVSINNVNTGGPKCNGATSFSQYHNALGSAYMAYNQRTKNLVARLPVKPCQKYTFYLVVADRRDAILDTGVFIQSLNSNPPSLSVTTNSVIKDAMEGCITANVALNRTGTARPAESFKIVLEGSATFGTDYDVEYDGVNVSANNFLVNFNANEAAKTLKLKAKLDGVTEPTETVIVKLYRLNCGSVAGGAPGDDYLLGSKTVNILDKDGLDILENSVSSTLYRCTDATPMPTLKGILADAYAWETVGGTLTCTNCREITPPAQTSDATYKLKATFGDCIIERTININYSVLKVNTPPAICGGQPATLLAEGRTSYTWTPATGLSCTDCASPTANPAVTTTYTVTGTEGGASGCTSSTTVIVEVLAQTNPQFVGLASQYCSTAAAVTLAATPSGGTFTINNNPATVFDPAVLGAGTHTVKYVKGGSNAACAGTVTQTVTVYNAPVVTITAPANICKNASPIVPTVTPAGGVFKINGATVTSLDPALYPLGNVTITYTVTDNTSGCSTTKSATVEILGQDLPQFVGLASKYCVVDAPVTLVATPAGGSFTIDNNPATIFNPASLGAGDHVVKYVKNIGGSSCSDFVSKTVTVYNMPVVTLSAPVNMCKNATPVSPTVTPAGGTLKVNGTTVTQIDPLLYPAGNVTVTYTVTDNISGCSTTKTTTVEILAQPSPQFVGLASQYCINDAPITLVATPTGGTFVIDNNPATIFNPANLGAGQHLVKYIKNVGGTSCADFVEKTVMVYDLPVITLNVPTIVCKESTPVAISATPAGGTLKINGVTKSEIDPALYPVGVITVTYSIIDNVSGCLNTKSIDVAIGGLPTYVWEDVKDAYCLNETITVTPRLKITQTDGSIEYKNFASFVPSVDGLLGSKVLTATVVGKNTCTAQVSKTISFATPPTVAFVGLFDEYCQQALPVDLAASPSGGIFKVNGVAQGQFKPTDYQIGDIVKVEYFYSNAGCEITINKDVRIVQGTTYVPVVEKIEGCPPSAQGFPLEALTAAQHQQGYKYEWTSTVAALDGQRTRVLFVREDQEGTHKVLIRDASNCPIAEKTFEVKIKCNTAFFIPTGFTPNGDNVNDILQIYGADFTKLRFTIYNRWGEAVFTSRNKSELWDGTLNGAPAPAGVYTWKASYESLLQRGKVIEQRGFVTLIR